MLVCLDTCLPSKSVHYFLIQPPLSSQDINKMKADSLSEYNTHVLWTITLLMGAAYYDGTMKQLVILHQKLVFICPLERFSGGIITQLM